MTGTIFSPMRNASDIELGQTVRDRLSGLVGIAVCRVEYLTGCTQVGIAQQGLTSEGKTKEWHYFDWQRIEVDRTNPNSWKDVRASEPTRQSNGAGEPPRGRY